MRNQLLHVLLLAIVLGVLTFVCVELFDIFFLGRQPRPWWLTVWR